MLKYLHSYSVPDQLRVSKKKKNIQLVQLKV